MLVRFWIPRTVYGWTAAVIVLAILAALIFVFVGDPAKKTGAALLVILAVSPAGFIGAFAERSRIRDEAVRQHGVRVSHGALTWDQVSHGLAEELERLPPEQAPVVEAILKAMSMMQPLDWWPVTEAIVKRPPTSVRLARAALTRAVNDSGFEAGIACVAARAGALAAPTIRVDIEDALSAIIVRSSLSQVDYHVLAGPLFGHI